MTAGCGDSKDGKMVCGSGGNASWLGCRTEGGRSGKCGGVTKAAWPPGQSLGPTGR